MTQWHKPETAPMNTLVLATDGQFWTPAVCEDSQWVIYMASGSVQFRVGITPVAWTEAPDLSSFDGTSLL